MTRGRLISTLLLVLVLVAGLGTGGYFLFSSDPSANVARSTFSAPAAATATATVVRYEKTTVCANLDQVLSTKLLVEFDYRPGSAACKEFDGILASSAFNYRVLSSIATEHTASVRVREITVPKHPSLAYPVLDQVVTIRLATVAGRWRISAIRGPGA
jgi:hypothetical protein